MGLEELPVFKEKYDKAIALLEQDNYKDAIPLYLEFYTENCNLLKSHASEKKETVKNLTAQMSLSYFIPFSELLVSRSITEGGDINKDVADYAIDQFGKVEDKVEGPSNLLIYINFLTAKVDPKKVIAYCESNPIITSNVSFPTFKRIYVERKTDTGKG